MTTMRSSQPCVKLHDCSRSHATSKALYWRIALLGRGKEMGPRQGYLPSIVATPRQSRCTIIMFLTAEITDPVLRPVGLKTRPYSQIENLDTVSNFLDNARL